jgi:hypothetical protein
MKRGHQTPYLCNRKFDQWLYEIKLSLQVEIPFLYPKS